MHVIIRTSCFRTHPMAHTTRVLSNRSPKKSIHESRIASSAARNARDVSVLLSLWNVLRASVATGSHRHTDTDTGTDTDTHRHTQTHTDTDQHTDTHTHTHTHDRAAASAQARLRTRGHGIRNVRRALLTDASAVHERRVVLPVFEGNLGCYLAWVPGQCFVIQRLQPGGKSQVRADSLAQHKQSAIPASVRTRTPHLPATRPLHDGSVPIPSGVTIPIPVTTTRRTGTVSGGAGSDAIVRVRMSVATVALATRRPSAFVPCRATRPMYRILLALSAIFSDLDSFVRSWPACLEACANRHRAHAADSCITHTRSLRYQSCVATDPHRLFLFRPKLKF